MGCVITYNLWAKCVGVKGQASQLHLVLLYTVWHQKQFTFRSLMCSRMYPRPNGPAFMDIHFQQHTHGDSGVRVMLFPDRWASSDGLPSPDIELAPHYFPSIPPRVDSVSLLLLPLVSAQWGFLGTMKTTSSLNNPTCSLWKVHTCNRNPAQHSIDYYL